MTIDSVRTSNVGQVHQDNNEPQVNKGGGGAPPKQLTKGQVFGKQLGKDFSFVPLLLGGSFKGTASLAKSFQHGKELMRTKDERLTHLKDHIPGLKAQLFDKEQELATIVDDLRNSDVSLSDNQKKAIHRYYEKILGGDHNPPPPSSLRSLLRDNPELRSALDAKLNEHKNLVSDLDKSIAEQRMLTKLTHGKLASKAIRTGLLGLASPFISAFTTVMVAPLLPIWGATALVRAGVYAGTGKLLGNLTQEGLDTIQKRTDNKNNADA